MLSFGSRALVLLLAGLAWAGRCPGQDGQTDKGGAKPADPAKRSEEHTSVLQSH